MSLSVVFAVIIFLIIIFACGYRNEKAKLRQSLDEKLASYGQVNRRRFNARDLEHISSYEQRHKSEGRLDDTTWNDLDMWSVFGRMDYCISSAGDEYLYYMLRNPKEDPDELKRLEELLTRLDENDSQRNAFIKALMYMGRFNGRSIYEYTDRIKELKDFDCRGDIVLDVLLLLGIVICAFKPLLGVLLLVVLIVWGILTYFKKKNIVGSYIACFEYIFRLSKAADNLASLDFEGYEAIGRLKEMNKTIGRIEKCAGPLKDLGSGNPLSIVFDYIKMITHVDFIIFSRVLGEMKECLDDIDSIIECVGSIDACISIASYRRYVGSFARPVFTEDIRYKAKEIYHPLLEKPVANDLDTVKPILLTGSNASGKSTFLKTLALNAILAQSINTVFAAGYEAPICRVITSLNIKDSLSAGESYYMAEINSMKRILDAAKESEVPVFAFVDEILRGTNTTERIAAGSHILYSMSGLNTLVFAATHDLELTSILEGVYEDYYFLEMLEGADVAFPYKMEKGVASSKNAIKLLRFKGYDETTADKAARMAEHFEKTGVWTL